MKIQISRRIRKVWSGSEFIKLFPRSTQLSMKFHLLINVKMPTTVGILTFISMINTTSERLKARNFFICPYFSFYELLKFRAQLSWALKSLINLGASFSFPPPLTTHRTHIEDFDQTAQMRRLIRVLNGHTCQLVLLLDTGSICALCLAKQFNLASRLWNFFHTQLNWARNFNCF